LRTLVLWSLSSSDAIKQIINTSYKGNRRDDDLNQPLSVQPWGSDSDKRRYFLIEGLDDTNFRVYRESNPAGFNRTWWSVAGSIDELRALADKLQKVDGGPKGKKLAQQMLAAIPRFEASEEKRKRREYRQQQKERFKRPEPGFSMYEGRTRGKRMKYTYSDDEDFLTDSTGVRRSTRNTGTTTPAEPAGPVTTASGRQIKAPSRMTVDASNNIVTVDPDQEQISTKGASTRGSSKESSVGPTGRPRRSAAINHRTNGWSSTQHDEYNSMDDDEDSEPDLGDDEDDHVPDESEDEEDEFDEDVEMADDDNDLDDSPRSMVVKLKVPGKEGAKIDLNKYRYNGAAPKTNEEPTATDLGEKGTTEEPITVAQREKTTPEPHMDASDAVPAPLEQLHISSTPNSLQTKPLAYRESPEKFQAAPPPVADRPVG
jgi:hypothetical protein